MEGDVLSILPRPTLPPSSPDPTSTQNNNALHRYASRDLRTRETQAEIEKWDAWHACAGMSRTEAKRQYISTLIETMKVYASGTTESRELVGELEFVWSQIRSQSGSIEEQESPGESPTRRLERAGLKTTESYASIPGGRESRTAEDSSRLRVLSPVSRGGSGEIVEGEDVDEPEVGRDRDEEDEEQEFRDARDGSEGEALDRRRRPDADDGEEDDTAAAAAAAAIQNRKWRRRIESALTKMTAEIAALREQMEESTVFPRRRTGLWTWMRWLLWGATRHILVNLALIILFVLWGRWKGDRRTEEWVKRRWKSIRALLQTMDLRQRIHLPSFVSSRLSTT